MEKLEKGFEENKKGLEDDRKENTKWRWRTLALAVIAIIVSVVVSVVLKLV